MKIFYHYIIPPHFFEPKKPKFEIPLVLELPMFSKVMRDMWAIKAVHCAQTDMVSQYGIMVHCATNDPITSYATLYCPNVLLSTTV
jgi:hypothetical protein